MLLTTEPGRHNSAQATYQHADVDVRRGRHMDPPLHSDFGRQFFSNHQTPITINPAA
jgi:hypothetical protein